MNLRGLGTSLRCEMMRVLYPTSISGHIKGESLRENLAIASHHNFKQADGDHTKVCSRKERTWRAATWIPADNRTEQRKTGQGQDLNIEVPFEGRNSSALDDPRVMCTRAAKGGGCWYQAVEA
ncbi:hypothetical protein K438DRAFT_1769194 [Mycena galopus ATCC 62051]|nr:hypothetical protein K438DRAFT_1769194 [Mycena galopus ATCC 62051]